MKSKTLFIFTLMIFSLCTLAFIYFSIFLLKKIEKISDKILEAQRENFSFTQRLQNIEEFQRIKSERKDNLSLLENLLFNQDLPLPFVTFLEDLAKEKQILLEISVQENPKSQKDPFPSLYFLVKFQGSFQSIFTFLKKIEKGPFLLQFEKMRISKMGEGGGLEGEVLIKVFVKK